MAIKTRYRIKNSKGKYETVHFQTSADLVVTSDDLQFVTKEEKQKINSVKTHLHNQIASAAVWDIQHNLGKFPSVSVIDSAGNVVVGDVMYLDENQLKITFSAAFAGKAFLN